MKADLSQIPESATINKAELKLYCYSLRWPYNPKLDLYGVTYTWEEGTGGYYQTPDSGATWYQYNVGTGDWAMPGGDVDTSMDFGYGPNGLVSEAVMQEDSWVTFDITGLAQKWVSGEIENNGVLIQAIQRGYNAARFYSSEYADDGLRPELVIEYSY